MHCAIFLLSVSLVYMIIIRIILMISSGTLQPEICDICEEVQL